MQPRKGILEQVESLPGGIHQGAATAKQVQSAPRQAVVSKRESRRSRSLSGRFGRWVAGLIVQDVPEGDAICEFDCQRAQCTEEEWAHCERRISKAAGELWPGAEPQTASEAPPAEERNPGTVSSE